MNESRISPEYEEGVEQFLQFASQRGQPDEDGKYYCPCINCLNGRRQILDDIREHLLCDGIKRNYTTWIWHGDISLVIVLIGMDGVVGSLCLALGLQNFILYWLVSVLGRFGSPN